MHIKSQILIDFLNQKSKYFDFQKEMRKCRHNSSNNDLLNKYHIENDLWSHTMLVLNSIYVDDLDLNDTYIICLTALLHDIGKIYTRTEKLNNSGVIKVHFINHSNVCVQLIIDICYDILKDKSDIDIHKIIKSVVFLIYEHNNFYDLINLILTNDNYKFIDNKNIKIQEKIKKFFNNDLNLFLLMCRFIVGDIVGRFTTEERFNILDFQIFKNNFINVFNKENNNANDIKYWIYCGLPGSGKDYYAKLNNFEIFSFDDIRIKEFITNNKNEIERNHNFYDDFNFLYACAFNWCNDNKINLYNLLKNKLKDFKYSENSSQKSIAICNTTLTKKSQIQLLNLYKEVFGNVKIGCCFILIPTLFAINNDKNRSDKHVNYFTQPVIKKMSENIHIPTLFNGFDYVEYIFNINTKLKYDN